MLPQKNRLKSNREISQLFATGKTVRNSFLFLRYSKNDLDISRFAFSIGLKYSGKAVDRNRLKRILREGFRSSLKNIKTGFDGVFFVSKSLTPERKMGSKEAAATIEALLKKAGLWQNKNDKQ